MRRWPVRTALALLLAMPLAGCSAQNTAGEKAAGSQAPASSRIAARTKEQNRELGRQHKTAADLFRRCARRRRAASDARVGSSSRLERRLHASHSGRRFRVRSRYPAGTACRLPG